MKMISVSIRSISFPAPVFAAMDQLYAYVAGGYEKAYPSDPHCRYAAIRINRCCGSSY